MPKINPRIKSIDDLLGLDAAEESPIEPTPSVSLPTKNTIITLPPQAIRAFRGHPFRLYEGDRLNDLVESISEHGVLNPAIIRKIQRDEDGFEYEMLAGHNRQNAAAIANRELPCIVKENLSDEDAWIYVIETNVLQRSFSEMLPSEKAAVLALRYSKMVCQGRRNDIVEELKRLENPDEIGENGTCGSDFHKSKSREALGAEYNLTGRSVATYLRINELSEALKIRIDNGEFAIAVAVQLSYLTEQEQQMVDDVLFTSHSYKKLMNNEIETGLSIITSSYLRSESMITAVEENIHYLNPPVADVFRGFLAETNMISADVKQALSNMKPKLDNYVFREWVDAAIACQDDKSLKSTLTPIIGKLSDMRIVAAELDYLLYEPFKEFITMAFLLIGNIPLLYFLNKDWYDVLVNAAVELYGFCPDVIDQGPEDATVGALADVLRQSTVWYFWWD